MPTDALDDYITPYVLGDEAWMERLRPDAWLAMWARIGRNYVGDFIISAGLGEPMPSGYTPECTEEFKREARAYLESLGHVPEQVQTQISPEELLEKGPGTTS